MRQVTPTSSDRLKTPGADFLRAFLKNWKEVGWPLQTSHDASKKICDAIDFRTARRVVEIGAGTGNITKELLKRLAADGELIAFEINRDLCKHLQRIEDPRLVVCNTSGFRLYETVGEKVDYVISALPIATLSTVSFLRFYDGVKAVLNDGGYCIQVQLSLLSYPSLRRLFRTVDIAVCFRNSLPLFIYSCKV